MKYALILLALVSNLAIADQCQSDKLSIHKNFAMGRYNQCQQLAPDSYRLTLKPENLPINPSPWYALKLESRQVQQIELELLVEHGKPRYLPKVSLDKQHWQPVDYQIDGQSMHIKLALPEGTLWLAGQEILDNDDYQQWQKQWQAKGLALIQLGQSVQGKPIEGLISHADSRDWLVFIGRQHPPEITGAMAMNHFVDEVLGASTEAAQLRKRFNLLLVPNMNPDGVYAGNWRHNVGGVDLNRDWFSREQPEIQAVHQYLQKIVASGGKIRFAMDFHSTHHDVFYTMPTDYGLTPPDLVDNWLAKLAEVIKPYPVNIKPGHNKDRGVFKQYIADTYGVHAVTYEVGDNTDRQDIADVARAAARQLMEVLQTLP
ncbi:succinylglutamate desuccinylase/aspartoacylase family protein [Bowmanella sp. Y26]|uniref:M14 family metallopeptidase n=1 Tax=Bowmanella yangjiangensis TaxID=2811230 RepID=UPI001BDC6218|nr:M14 family metallopeptidase [Bowmanella yangjiangensis]MBT1063964.1 succinylglutamate desuccinylase/aspartoacylase family protein [Bowmanella yangjiangensis]